MKVFSFVVSFLFFFLLLPMYVQGVRYGIGEYEAEGKLVLFAGIFILNNLSAIFDRYSLSVVVGNLYVEKPFFFLSSFLQIVASLLISLAIVAIGTKWLKSNKIGYRHVD